MRADASGLVLRDERPEDIAAIDEVTLAAFTGQHYSEQTEPFIVQHLRAREELVLSGVAVLDGRLVGQISVSPVSMADGSSGWLGLGPLSVLPGLQRSGIGSALMRHALDRLRAAGAAGCVLLGDPGYYLRFGFQVVPGLTYAGGPAGHFQALSFTGAFPQGEVAYSPAFQARARP